LFYVKRLRFGSVFLNQVNGDAFDKVFEQHSKLQFNTNKATGIKNGDGEVKYLEQTFLHQEQLPIHLKSV